MEPGSGFPQDSQWETEYSEVSPLIEELKSYSGRLGESAETLLASLQLRDKVNYRLERLYAYARMRRDEDNTNPHYQALEDRARVLWTRVEESSAFFNPELLQVGQDKDKHFHFTKPSTERIRPSIGRPLPREGPYAQRTGRGAVGGGRRDRGGSIADFRHAERRRSEVR